jgi:hypothetical protein
VDRAVVRLLKFVALIGLGLSLTGLVLMLGIRVEQVTRMPLPDGAVGQADALRHVLDGLKEAGVTFLLSALLYVGCVVAQNVLRPEKDTPAD